MGTPALTKLERGSEGTLSPYLDGEETKGHNACRDELEPEGNPPHVGSGRDMNTNANYDRERINTTHRDIRTSSQLMK